MNRSAFREDRGWQLVNRPPIRITGWGTVWYYHAEEEQYGVKATSVERYTHPDGSPQQLVVEAHIDRLTVKNEPDKARDILLGIFERHVFPLSKGAAT